ncbi:MAG: recombinase family protein [Eubacterium sp.]|nr:recombinase family protein [Eubacterium sp.]
MNAVAYARYSTDRQTENSIAYQFTKIQEYCLKKNINLTGFYSDEARSGTNTTDRTEFNRMLADAEKHKFNAVVIYDISRGSRDVEDWFHFRKTMMSLKIDVISTSQQLGDFTDPNNFLMELINVGLGQHMVLDVRKKSIDGALTKAKECVFMGGHVLYGYSVVNRHFVINPPEAEIVKDIFTMYADGKSYDDILKKYKDVRGRNGRPLGKNTLSSMLRNEKYKGTYTFNKRQCKLLRKWAGGKLRPESEIIKVENGMPAIVTNDIWERVKFRMENRPKATNKATRHDYLLSGLIECEKCGQKYVGHTSTNKKGYKTSYYVCGNKYRTKTCDNKNINAEKLETFVVISLKNYLEKMDYNEIAEKISTQINSASENCEAEKTELGQINNKIQNGVNAILSGINIPELETEIDSLRTRKSELEDLIAYKEANKPNISKEDIINLFKYSAAHIDDANLKTVIQNHVAKITAHTDGSITVHIGVHLDSCGGRI